MRVLVGVCGWVVGGWWIREREGRRDGLLSCSPCVAIVAVYVHFLQEHAVV